MDNILYNALCHYYHVLELTGYVSFSNVVKLLILVFYHDYIYHDYRGVISRNDYRLIERALNCLYGSSCLIPYPNYLKMGKLYLGDLSEFAQRIKDIEDTKVVKLMDIPSGDTGEDSDVVVILDNDE